MIRSAQDSRGFSLIELLVVMAMLAVVLTATYSIYITQWRSSVVSDDVAELQQNLRIGIDQMTRDLKMAGFLACTPCPGCSPDVDPQIIMLAGADSGLDNSDTITFSVATSSGRSARISKKIEAAAGTVTFDVESAEDADKFVGESKARIVSVDVNGINDKGPAAPFTIVGVNRNLRQITLSGLPGITYNESDLIVDVGATAAGPTTVQYCVGSKTGGCVAPACPDDQKCLVRSDAGQNTVIASNITDLQLQYLLYNNVTKAYSQTDIPTPVDYPNVRAVRITLSGETAVSKALTRGSSTIVSRGGKQRQIASLVELRNRPKPCQ